MTNNTYIVLKREFTAIRVFEYSMTPVTFTLKIECSLPHNKTKTPSEQIKQSSVAHQLINIWLANVLDDVVVVDPTTEMGEFLLATTENNIMTTPGNPDDNVLARLIHSKLSTIAKGNIHISKLVLVSSDTDHTERHWTGTDYLLPESSYKDDDETVHSDPWWKRYSFEVSDYLSSDLDEDTKAELLAAQGVLEQYEQKLSGELFVNDNEAEILEDIWKK